LKHYSRVNVNPKSSHRSLHILPDARSSHCAEAFALNIFSPSGILEPTTVEDVDVLFSISPHTLLLLAEISGIIVSELTSISLSLVQL